MKQYNTRNPSTHNVYDAKTIPDLPAHNSYPAIPCVSIYPSKSLSNGTNVSASTTTTGSSIQALDTLCVNEQIAPAHLLKTLPLSP